MVKLLQEKLELQKRIIKGKCWNFQKKVNNIENYKEKMLSSILA